MSDIQNEEEPNNMKILEANNKKYKKELSRLDILVERLEFENQMIYEKLQKQMREKEENKLKIKNNIVEREQDVDLNFNTRVNYVEFLQKKIAELKDFCRTSNVNELAIKNEELRAENVYLQEKLTSLGLRIEDLKNQKASAGQKLIEKTKPKKAEKSSKKNKKNEIKLALKKQQTQFEKDTVKLRSDLKRFMGENRVLSKTKTKLAEELDKAKEMLESEKEKTIWLNQENLRMKQDTSERDKEREKMQEMKGRGKNDINRLEREVKLANFMRDKEIKKMEKIKKNLDLQLKGHFYGMEDEEDDKKEEKNQEEQIEDLMKKLEKVRKKFASNMEELYEAQRTARNAEMLKIKAEKLKIANDREILQMKELVKDLDEYKEKANKFDELKIEVNELREIKNQFDIFKREAENFVKVKEEKTKLEKDLKQTRLELEKTRLMLNNAEETVREQKFELGNFELMKAGIQAKADAKVEQCQELMKRAEIKTEKLYDEMGKLATEKIFLEVLQANNDKKKENLQEIIRELQAEKNTLKEMSEKQRQSLFENERVRLERDRMEIKIDEYEKELKEVKDEKHKKERQLNEVFGRYGDFGGLKDQIEDLNKKLKERDGQIMDMVFEINTRAREIDEENKQIDELSDELRETKKKLRKLEHKLNEKKLAGEETGIIVDEEVLEELETLKREVKSKDLMIKNRELEKEELETLIEELKSGKEEFVPLREVLIAKSETEQYKADMERQKERADRILKEKKMLEELMEYNDDKVKQLHIDISEVREELNKALLENKEMNRGMRDALKRQQEQGLEIEELKDIIQYKDELIKLEKKNVEREKYLADEAKKEARDSRERVRKAEEKLPEIEDRLVELENEKIDMEENQIFVINNFLERIQSKDKEIQRKIDTLGYKDTIIQRLTNDKTRLTNKTNLMEKLIKEYPEIEAGNKGHVSGLRISNNKSTIGKTSRLKSKIRFKESNNESRMGFISGGAILADIDMVVREKEMNQKLKEQVKILNDRVKELEGSLEGGTKMLTENASRLQKELKNIEMERQRLLIVEKEKVFQDGMVKKMEEVMKQFASEKLAAEITLKQTQEKYKKNMEEMNKEIEEINKQMNDMITMNSEQLGNRDKTMENLILKLRNKERERQELEEDNGRLEKELSSMTNEKEYLTKDYKEAMKKIKKKDRELEKNKIYIQEILEETDMRGAMIKTLDKRVESMELGIKVTDDNIKKMKESHGDILKAKEAEIALLEKELESNRVERDNLQKQRDQFMDEKKELLKKIDDLDEENRILQGDIDEYNGKVDEYVEFLEKKKQILENKLASKMAELDEARLKLENNATGDAKELTKKNNELKKKISRADVIMEKMWDKVKGLKEKNDDLMKVVNKMNNDPQRGTKAFKQLNDDFNMVKMAMDKYVREKEKERQKLTKEKDEVLKEKYSMIEVIKNLKKENVDTLNKLTLAEIKLFAMISRIHQMNK
jgi:chromosome segregation ATPase